MRDAAALCQGPAVAARRPRLPARKPPPDLVLTFDAAWTTTGAKEVLDALRSRGVQATFFVAGRFVKAQPALVRRIAAEGHEVGNHTFRHGHLTRYAIDRTRAALPEVTAATLTAEMEAMREAYEGATGAPLAPLWRAPYGETNDQILAWGEDLGYKHVGWSPGLDALDWVSDPDSPLYETPRAAVSRILRTLKRRSRREGAAVVLMHLGSERPAGMRFAEALPLLIDGARALGYRIVTAGEAVASGTLP
jgi:peptidoglycan/xylan/chitin deacetylase (PgdA/CDA1 family)